MCNASHQPRAGSIRWPVRCGKIQRRSYTVIANLNEQARHFCVLARDANRSRLIERMGVPYGVDQGLSYEQADGGRLFGGDSRLSLKAALDFRLLGIGKGEG